MRWGTIAVLTVVSILGCRKVDTVAGPTVGDPYLAISDGAHTGGNQHFYFLPPMVENPSVGGLFDPSLSPRVTICEWTGLTCIMPVLAEFTTTTGPGSETVRLSTDDEHYIVNWHTNEFNLDEDLIYRIQVHVNHVLLGFADVDVVSSGKQLKNVDTNQYIALKDGRTLPIKFRIEDGAVGPALLFRSERDGNPEIYGVNADGTALTRLTFNNAVDQLPVWSPDQALIAFVSDRDGNGEIYVMNNDGTNQTNLTDHMDADGGTPAWSPDGTRIAFTSNRNGAGSNGSQDIYVMNADGTNVIRLTTHPGDDGGPSWSPDGTTIAFASSRDRGSSLFDIYTMNASDGSNVQRLTFTPGYSQNPAWSPDGSKIAFVSNRPGSSGPDDIWVMNADGSDPVNLTTSSDDVQGGGGRVGWSLDGSMIVFATNRDAGNWDVYVMNSSDGSNLIRVTNHGSDDLQPSWRR